MDRFALYDLCVSQPDRLVPFLHAVHGGRPRSLREDFAGTASVARHWLQVTRGGTALAVDLDAKPLAHAVAQGVDAFVGNVMACPTRADVVTATGFSLGYCHTRAQLLGYLHHARACLAPRGVFVADVYGGTHAWLTGQHVRTVELPDGGAVEYVFEQRKADPVTAQVENVLHFAVRTTRRGKLRRLRNAFVFRWRLWSPAELSDALHDVGFARVDWFDDVGDASGRGRPKRLKPGQLLGDDWVLHVAASRGRGRG